MICSSCLCQVNEEHVGLVMEALSHRRGEITDMGPVPGSVGRTRLCLTCPSRHVLLSYVIFSFTLCFPQWVFFLFTVLLAHFLICLWQYIDFYSRGFLIMFYVITGGWLVIDVCSTAIHEELDLCIAHFWVCPSDYLYHSVMSVFHFIHHHLVVIDVSIGLIINLSGFWFLSFIYVKHRYLMISCFGVSVFMQLTRNIGAL